MKKSPRLISLMAALVIGLCIQIPSAWAQGNSPESVVKNFVSAYFMLDNTMGDYLSEAAKTNENDVDMVELHLRLQDQDAWNRGYKTSYLQMHPILTTTQVLEMDEETAQVQVDVITLRSINPLYRAVGYIFGLLEEHEFQDTITLVKEDGEWKIAPGAFNMPI